MSFPTTLLRRQFRIPPDLSASCPHPGHDERARHDLCGTCAGQHNPRVRRLGERDVILDFSDVFEEGGPIARPFVGMFELRAEGGINKPSYYGFVLLHQLGDRRIANEEHDAIVTLLPDGSLVIAAWNLVDPGQHGQTHSLTLVFRNVPADARVTIQRVDDDHGNVLPKYAAMGNPLDPTPQQVEELNRETALGPPESTRLRQGKLKLTLTPDGLALLIAASK